ncbi:MAG: ROK family protein [Blastocatellia bacterium]|nr:ROK family protein [Blastocatellia bacterium]
MGHSVGVIASDYIAVGKVDNNSIHGTIQKIRESETDSDYDFLAEMPADDIITRIGEQIVVVADGEQIPVVGIGFPGIIRDGIVLDSPNLQQVKGRDLASDIATYLAGQGIDTQVFIFNDADVLAAGVAATYGYLDRVVRGWYLGVGIGFGRYPQSDGVWEGGHFVVTLDPKEQFCQCGGRGHLEGIMGVRAMRLRFMDMEPEEVFEQARYGDKKCSDFVKLWHRALAAATATSVHVDGPGKFFIFGPNARFVQVGLLDLYLQEMVKMSPLQGSHFEVIKAEDALAIIGAAINAEQATRQVEFKRELTRKVYD